MFVFSFDICVSDHDLLQSGVLCDPARHLVIDILADGDSQSDHDAAQLTALQIGFHIGYPTQARVRI